MRCKKNIPFITIAFVALLIVALYGVAYMDAALSRQSLTSYDFFTIWDIVLKHKPASEIYGYLVAIISMVFLYLYLVDTKPYKSGQMQITDTIFTPVAAGQGQCGTAKWLPKKDYNKVFCSYEFDADEWKEWISNNLNDIQEELLKIDKMDPEEVKKQVDEISKGEDGRYE